MARPVLNRTPFERCWQASGLRLIHWSVYDSAMPVRSERRKARQHWMLYAMLAGRAVLRLPHGPLVLETPTLALLRPQRAFLEDLEPSAEGILLATIDFEVLTLPGWSDPLQLLSQPASVRLIDPAPVLGLVRVLQGQRSIDIAGRLRSRGLVDQLLSELLIAGASGGALVPAARRIPPWLADTRAVIAARWSDPTLDLTAMARQAGVDRSRFCREFHAAFGLPPMAWLRRERLTNACRMLRHAEDLPVAAVARACGYASPGRFSRHFRALCGLSPRQWRAAAVQGGSGEEWGGDAVGPS